MKNKKQVIIVGIAIFAFAFLIEILGFNFKVLFLNTKIDITEKIKISKDKKEKNIFDLKLPNQYINKLKIIYSSKKNESIKIEYIGDDYYGKNKKNKIKDTFNSKIDTMVLNLDNNIKELKFNYSENVIIKKVIIDNKIHFNLFRYLYILTFEFIILLLICLYKKRFLVNSIHKTFFIFSILIGSLIIIFQPSTAQYSWDEQIHFNNTYRLLKPVVKWKENARMMSETFAFNDINSIEEQYKELEVLNKSNKVVLKEDGKLFVNYNEVGYLFLSVGYNLGDIFGLPFYISFKLGKIFNLIMYSLIFSYAIYKSKNSKRILSVIGLLPTSIFTACQYSYDAAVLSGLVLACVYLLNALTYDDVKIDFKFIFVFLISMFYSSFVKAVYAPIMLLFLLIPTKQFKNKKVAKYSKIIVFLLCLMIMATFVLPAITSNAVGDSRGGDTSVSLQLQLILSHPLGYSKLLNNTMISEFMNMFIGVGAIGMYAYIGYINTNLYIISLIFLIFVFITDIGKSELNIVKRGVIILSILAIILLIWTALYLSFTPVGLNIINGVQPRYFLPLLFIFGICVHSQKIKCNMKQNFYDLLVFTIPSFILMISIYQMFLKMFCL